MARARREALLRMKAAAHDRGFGAVLGVRLETAGTANDHRGGTTGIEVLSYGTGVRRG